MRTATVIAAAVAAGVVGAGAVVTPVVIAASDGGAIQTSNRHVGPRGAGMDPGDWGRYMHHRQDGFGSGAGMGPGMMRSERGWRSGGQPGRGPGENCPLLDERAKGTLTPAQKQTLAHNAEEEKLAHDVYLRLADSSGDQRFVRIAAAESRHLTAVRTVLARYAVVDPTKGLAQGEFSTASVAADYQRYVATGTGSAQKALEVGQQIERTDVAELEGSQKGLDAPDVEVLYGHLQRASQMHLQALSRTVTP